MAEIAVALVVGAALLLTDGQRTNRIAERLREASRWLMKPR
jgi:hypothetical protein